MSLEPCYFGSESHRLYGVLHSPAKVAATALTFCPPFAEEMVTTYARLARWARELEARNIAAFRFHPFGTGESGGSFRNFSLLSTVEDLKVAGEWARQKLRPATSGYFGLRLGATLAVHAASQRPVDQLVLWSPIVNISQYLRELFRSQLTKELVLQKTDQVRRNTKDMIAELEADGTIDMLGFEFPRSLYREFTQNWIFPTHPPAKRILWLARPAEEKAAAEIVHQWQAGDSSEVRFEVVPEPAFWEEYGSEFANRFAQLTLNWLGSENSSAHA